MQCKVLFAAIMCLAGGVASADAAANTAADKAPQCAPTPRDCVALALAAMGGRERIEGPRH